MNQRVVPFLLGMTVGFWGVRWFVHLGWLTLTVVAFCLGHHLG